jgi:hypothetical protein
MELFYFGRQPDPNQKCQRCNLEQRFQQLQPGPFYPKFFFKEWNNGRWQYGR